MAELLGLFTSHAVWTTLEYPVVIDPKFMKIILKMTCNI
jgi:hypothetical protein